jgi:hypothetical protein
VWARRGVLAALVLVVAFACSLLTVELLNDHFDRISRGRQVLAYGERPFIDFRDPGYFLTLYASAAMQAISGGRLVGEAVLDSAAIAVAVALTFLLTAHAAQSAGMGLVAALFTLIVEPRYYDYDKVLFYTLGLAVAWQYADRRTPRVLIVFVLVTALAGLFRYDNGVFLFVVALVTLTVSHWHEPPTLARRMLLFVAGLLIVLAPVAMLWQETIGVLEVARQIRTYAEIEGPRTEIFMMPTFRFDTGPSGPSLFDAGNGVVVLYVVIVVLLPLAVARLWRKAPFAPLGVEHETAKIAPVVALGALVAVFILRNPLDARLGAAAPMAAVLAGWLLAPALPAHDSRRSARGLAIAAGGGAALFVTFLLAGRSAADLLQVSRTTSAGLAMLRELARVPPSLALLPDTAGMAAYVRACTPPGSRVLVTGFSPELYYLADRGFAGGMPVSFGGHWSSAQDQEITVERLQREFVTLAIVDPAFASTYGRVNAYLSSSFELAGVSSFGSPRAPEGGYQVLVRRGIGSTSLDSRWNLPCVSGWTPASTGRL